MRQRKIALDVREQVDSDLTSAGADTPRLFQAASRLLSKLSGEVGFVVAPDALHTVVDSLRFLPVAPGKILVVQISGPEVVSRVIETETTYSARELDAMSDLITREFCGRTLYEVRQRLMEAMAEEKAAYDRVRAKTLELGRRALEGNESLEQIYVDGTAQLLDKPEFSDVDSLKRVLQAFEEKARLLDLMTRYLDSKTCVVLGSEEDLASDRRLSAVLTSYGAGETLAGTLGVIGPARREYPRVIPVVELLGRALSERLERRERREKEGASR
jgi:heat-inducible transcriptional repressor